MNHEIRSVRDTVVAVTGASSGIGRAAARQLAAAGAKVVVTARRGERLTALAEEFPQQIATVTGDIADPGTSEQLVQTALDRFGRLDSIVLAAGVGMYGGILANSDAELSEMTGANYLGTVWGVRAALPALKENGGDIIVVASVAGLRGGGNEAVYAGTKAAQVVFARAVDREVRSQGVRVTTICPAAVNTEFAIGKGRTEGDPQLDTFMAPDDIAAAIVYTLQQPRRLRTTQWDLWSSAEAS